MHSFGVERDNIKLYIFVINSLPVMGTTSCLSLLLFATLIMFDWNALVPVKEIKGKVREVAILFNLHWYDLKRTCDTCFFRELHLQ